MYQASSSGISWISLLNCVLCVYVYLRVYVYLHVVVIIVIIIILIIHVWLQTYPHKAPYNEWYNLELIFKDRYNRSRKGKALLLHISDCILNI